MTHVGGVKYYSKNIIKGFDVICSGYNWTDVILPRMFGSTQYGYGKSKLMTRYRKLLSGSINVN